MNSCNSFRHSLPQVTLDLGNGPEEFEPLLEFINAMVACPIMKDHSALEDFSNIKIVLNAKIESPTSTVRATKYVKEMPVADHILLATFKVMPAGKRFVELAEEFAQGKVKDNENLIKFDAVRTDSAAFVEALGSGKTYEMKLLVGDCLRLAELFLAAMRSNQAVDDSGSDGKAAVKTSLEESKRALFDFLDIVVATHLSTESLAWMKEQIAKVNSDGGSDGWHLTDLYAWGVFRLRDIDGKIDQPRPSLLSNTIDFHDKTARLTDSMKGVGEGTPDRKVATSLCSVFTLWRESLYALVKSAGTNPSLVAFVEVSADLRKIIEQKIDKTFIESWRAILSKPLQLLSGIMGNVRSQGLQVVLASTDLHPEASQEFCAEASFLLTGLSDSSPAKADMQKATEYLRLQLESFVIMKANRESKDFVTAGKTLRGMFDMFKFLLDLPDDVKPSGDPNVTFAKVNLRFLVSINMLSFLLN